MDENISNMSDSENIPLSTRGKERSLGRARSRARSRVPTTPPRRPGIPPQSIATPPKVILSETHLSDRENTGSTTERIKRSTDIGPSFKSSESTSSGISSHSSANNQQETDIKTLSYKLSDVKLENKDILAATRSRGDMQSERAKERKKPRQKESHEPMLFTKPKEMPTKKGDTGQRIRLNANYFKLPTVTNWCLNQYRVDFQPQEDRNAVKSSILKEHKHELDGGYIFDGTVLYTPYKYQRDPLIIHSNAKTDGTPVCITIRLVGALHFGEYHYVHFFNLLMRRCLQNLNLQLVGRYYFDAQSRQRINEYKLELWPGYITSIRQHEQELLLCTEITHKVMRQETVFDLYTDCCDRNPTNYKDAFTKAILGSIVLTDYNNRTYRVDDVNFETSPLSTFDRNGVAITYMEYFDQKYEIKIKYPIQPMLISMPKQRDRKRGQDTRIYLVPELCRMTGLTDEMRSNFDLMKILAESTRLGPSQRMERLQNFNRRLHTNELVMKELKSWQMSLSETLISIPGRILPREKVILGIKEGEDMPIKCDPGMRNDWTSELKTKPMLSSAPVDSWVVILPRSLKYEVQQFVGQLRRSAAQMEWRLSDPTFRELAEDKTQNFVEALGHAIATCNPKFILVVLPTNRQDRYSAIKKKCCVECAVPTQVILKKNINSKNVPAIATKVAIQLNCKIGGAPWTVEIPMKGLMVVGFDVYHDSLQRGLSIGALVASLDKPMSRYFSAVSYHKNGEELSNELSANICKALHKFKSYNGSLPQRIVIYRDGVGEGQLQYVYRHEVSLLEETLNKMYAGAEVKLAFIVVTKRINTRLFCDGANPRPGTVVDDVITLPERYDFFLVSQSVRQGTVSPTSYNVIHDTLGLDPDKLQRLTYKLTHLYFNWSGAVRVPAPVQYAHKLAYLIGQALHKTPNSHLEEYLYFL